MDKHLQKKCSASRFKQQAGAQTLPRCQVTWQRQIQGRQVGMRYAAEV